MKKTSFWEHFMLFYHPKKLLIIMKLTLFLCIIGTLGLSAETSYSQEAKLSIALNNGTVTDLLKSIGEKSEFSFWYNSNIVNNDKRISLNVKDLTVDKILDLALLDQNLSYSIKDKVIIIYKSNSGVETTVKQKVTVKGTVTDGSNQQPLPGVNITVSGTTEGVITDIDGKYSIDIPSASAVLVFSYIGYNSERVEVGNRSVIDISLIPDIKNLDEVVVVGYGTVKKSDLTGSVSSLKEKDMKGGPTASFDQMLNGKIAGVQVIQNSAEPGGGISVRVRGASSINAGTSPLYVIDGLPLDNSTAVSGSGAEFNASSAPKNPLSSINPEDIESIEILKDASATAIYGARGANGVIMVTTKSGSTGNSKIGYNGYYGVQNVAHKIDLLTPQEYQTVLNELIAEGASSASDQVTTLQDGGTDWQEELFHKNAAVQNHNLSIRGGKDKVNYYASLNYFDQDGVVKSSGYKRYGAKINLNINPFEQLQLGINLNSTYDRNNYMSTGFGINGEAGAIYCALNFDPSLAVKNAEGNYTTASYLDMDNPLASLYGKEAVSNNYRTFGTVFAKYTILPGLTAKVNLGGDVVSERKDVYVGLITKKGAGQGGIGSVLQGQKTNYLVEGTLAYDKKWQRHSVNTVVGVTTQKFINYSTYSEASQFPSDASGSYNLGLGTQSTYDLSGGRSNNKLLSYLARVNYDFDSRFLLTGSIRADGSSRFGENNKFGYFPSFAAGWKVHQENFMRSLPAVSVLKLRASWGQTGNQEIGNYNSLSTFTKGTSAIIDGELVTTTVPSRIANPDLRWETTEQTNLGIDFGFIENRISGTVDYYNKETSDMLLYLPVSASTGFTSYLCNIGSVENHGWEFALNTVNIDKEVKWNTSINMSTIKNEVKSLGGIEQIITGSAGQTSDVFLIRPGLPVYTFYGYKIVGIWQEGDDFSTTKDNVKPGDFKYLDVDKNGTVNAEDRVDLGNSFPKLVWSVGNNVSYKNFQLSVLIEGVHGVKMLNNNLVEAYFPVSFRRNRFAEPYLNRWTSENPSNKYPSFINPMGQGEKKINSYTVEDASYTRIKTVTLRYNIHCRNKLFNNSSVYVTGENLFTFTDYTGYDPAVNPNGGAYNRIDFNAYPSARTFLAGISLEF